MDTTCSSLKNELRALQDVPLVPTIHERELGSRRWTRRTSSRMCRSLAHPPSIPTRLSAPRRVSPPSNTNSTQNTMFYYSVLASLDVRWLILWTAFLEICTRTTRLKSNEVALPTSSTLAAHQVHPEIISPGTASAQAGTGMDEVIREPVPTAFSRPPLRPRTHLLAPSSILDV
ncbi:hypothetical protein C8R46DRAFT_1067308 [Mycena filopes]|nr:hypothetical protein C8R46DRAFT_1067308 [Mycena filopes]